MPALSYEILSLENQIPLVISRGIRTQSKALWVRLTSEGIEGWGEAGEFGLGEVEERLPQLESSVQVARAILERSDLRDRDGIESSLRTTGVGSAVRAAIDQALWDWAGKVAGKPAYELWGLDPTHLPFTFATIGIGSPESAQLRVRQWLETGDLRAFKIKLGAPAGPDADRKMFEAVLEVIPKGSLMSVDANGGWDPQTAVAMCRWLGQRGVDHIEQPLARGREGDLAQVRSNSPIPIILDESIFTAADLERLLLLKGFDGVNVKLMKCGGPSEALRIFALARKHGLKTMIGCYYHTALGNTAGASLGPLLDYLDLDSHLNLKADPFVGAVLKEGRLVPPKRPGFGVLLR